MECYVCPHRCGVDRPADMHAEGIFGSCHCGIKPIVARAALHFWEEPCISGEKGSGTVFFAAKKAAAPCFSAAATCTAYFARTTKSAA